MTTPAMRASSDLYCARTWPTSVEIAPSEMKTMLKPMMNAAELNITLRKSWPSFSFSCFDAHAGDQRNVSGHERKHAGRQERDQSRDEDGER